MLQEVLGKCTCRLVRAIPVCAFLAVVSASAQQPSVATGVETPEPAANQCVDLATKRCEELAAKMCEELAAKTCKEPALIPGEDARSRFEANIFAGVGVDNFAAGEVNKFLNPEVSSEIKNRWVGGFGIEYMFKEKEKEKDEDKVSRFWISLQTVHGVRSADVDCEKSPETPVCKPFTDVTSAGERTIYILRNASSLEGSAALRWEIFDWKNAQRRPNATLYAVGRLGFLTVAGSGGDIIDNHRIGIGTMAIEGHFIGSFLEAGFGRSDLFVDNSNRRWKLDGLLLFDLPEPLSGVRGFARIVVDVDFGKGSDSVQSYLGLVLPVERLFVKVPG